MNRNITPTRPHTPEETRLKEVLRDTHHRMFKLRREMEHHEQFVEHARGMCDHDWRGQDDVHPHGTPRETFVCTICGKEQVR